MRFFSDAAPYEKRANIRIAIIMAGFAIVAGFVPATAEDRPSDPFGTSRRSSTQAIHLSRYGTR